MCKRGDGGRTDGRRLAAGAVWLAALAGYTPACVGAGQWGGSLGLTSDYLVRAISRSDDNAALQLDLHYVDASGLLAGLFASNTQRDARAPRDAEISGYLGFAWATGSDWRGKFLASYYTYPWSQVGAKYDYGELDFDAGFQDWLEINLSYSPDTPRFLPSGYLVGVAAEAAELNLQRPVLGKLSGTAGMGYEHLAGPGPSGYAFWSVGAAYDWAPVSLALSYVDATDAAKALFYNAAARGRWTATVIWRF
jgi:uncharacterized protein (TIGR02001 family)